MNGSKDFVKETKKGRKRNGFWTEKKRKSVVWMCKMRKGSENKKKERKKKRELRRLLSDFGNAVTNRGDVGDGLHRKKIQG